MQQGGSAIHGAKNRLIKACSDMGPGVRMAIPFPAHILHTGSSDQTRDGLPAVLILRRLRQDQGTMDRLVTWGTMLSMIAPFRIVVPIDKTHQRTINLMDETPHPIHPKGIKSLNRGTANTWPAPVHIGSQPSHNSLRHCLIYATIL